MKKKLILGTVILPTLVLLLTGCSGSNRIKSTPSPIQTNSSTTTSPTGIDSGLILPDMQSPIPVVSSGVAVDRYGKQYVNDAFRSAFAFVYHAQQIPELWEPNSKKNSKYLGFAKGALTPLGNYFTPELNKSFQVIIPDLVTPLAKNGINYNSNADSWAKFILLSGRHIDGTLPFPKPGDEANYVLMSPWVFQTSVGAPITTVTSLNGYGSVLGLQFTYLIQQPFGDGKKIYNIVTTTHDMYFSMVKNTNSLTMKDYPWLIGSWGYVNNDHVEVKKYDAKMMGYFPNGSSYKYP